MEYKEIKVYLHTNLEELQENKRTILFESSKLIHPDVKNRTGLKKYPSVSFRMRQNYAALSELNFNQKMQFFFNTGSHLSLLRIYPNLFDKETNPYDESNPTKFFKEYNDIINVCGSALEKEDIVIEDLGVSEKEIIGSVYLAKSGKGVRRFNMTA
jgi:hypothetical protein